MNQPERVETPPEFTYRVHPCQDCGRTIRATYPRCWRCPPRTFHPHPTEPRHVIGRWRVTRRREVHP